MALRVLTANVGIQKLQRMIGMPAAELVKHVSVGALGHELFAVLRGANGDSPVQMARTHSLVMAIALGGRARSAM